MRCERLRVGSELWYERLFLVCSSSCSIARALQILILTFSINPFPSPLYPAHTNTVFKLQATPQSCTTQTLRWALPSYCLGIVSYRHIFTPSFLTMWGPAMHQGFKLRRARKEVAQPHISATAVQKNISWHTKWLKICFLKKSWEQIFHFCPHSWEMASVDTENRTLEHF